MNGPNIWAISFSLDKDIIDMETKDIVAQNDNVICIVESSSKKIHDSGFIYESDEIPTYRVVSIGPRVSSNSLDIKVGDVVTVNSTGTLIEDGSMKLYAFNIANVVSKLI